MTIDISALKANNPLEAVVQQFTGQVPVKHKIYAPWRAEETPSVHIYEDDTWYDFGAGVGGDLIDFLGHYFYGDSYRPDVHFSMIVDKLGALNIAPQQPTVAIEKIKIAKPRLNIPLEAVIDWHDTMPLERRAYWHSRGLTDATINSFLLGWDGKRYTIPAIYRSIVFGVKRRQSEIPDKIEEKYCMMKNSRAGIFNANCLPNTQSCIICEGEIDAMLLNQTGYHAVTSTAGAATWKEEWADLFAHVRNIYTLFDNDEAGREGENKVRLSLWRSKIVRLPDDIKDVGELYGKLGHHNASAWLHENIG